MRILHICIASGYYDNWSYQENVLSKYHKLQGHDVSVIATDLIRCKDGKFKLSKDKEYVDSNGISVHRIPIIKHIKRVRVLKGFEQLIKKINPDIIFIHNLQFLNILDVVKYARKNKVTIYVDNHADFTNSARTKAAKLFYKTFWRACAKVIEPYTKRFWGVLPSRVEFLKNVYKLPPQKCELLVMGADDELVKKSADPKVKENIREKYNVLKDDFLIVTGGKIDLFKKQTLLLMEAVKQMNNPKVKLLVFGSVVPELREDIAALCDENRVQYIGWVEAEKSYEYFAAADLVVFPGRHSVFWEQVVAQGIPMICKYWEGTTHIDIGGNVRFLYDDTVDEIKKEIEGLLNNPSLYEEMKKMSTSSKREQFLYNIISEKAIG